MAKDKTGYMSADVTVSQEPVAPNAALLEQAGAFRGKAAEIDGARTANTITTVAQVGEAAYKGYVASEAETSALEARDTITGLNPSPNIANRYSDRVKQIQEAVKAGSIDQASGTAIMGSEMRRLIAAHPGQADIIRKEYQTATGASNWDVRMFYESMTKDKVDKEAARIKSKVDDLVFTTATGMGYTPSDAESIVRLPVNDPVRKAVEETAGFNARIEQHKKTMDTQVAIGAHNSKAMATELKTGASLGVLKVTGEERINLHKFIKESGIDLSRPEQITPAQLATLTAQKDRILMRIEGAYENARQTAAQWATSRPGFTELDDVLKDIATQRENTIKMFDNMTDKGLLLSGLKTFSDLNNKNMAASLSQVQAMSQLHTFVKSVAGPQLIEGLSNPNTRDSVLKSNPNNAYVAALDQYLRATQTNSLSLVASTSKQLERYSQISEAIVNPAATPESKVALESATPQEKKDVAQILFSTVAPILRAGNASPQDSDKVVAATKLWAGTGQDLATMRDAVVTGKLFAVVGADKKEAATVNVLNVSEYHLSPKGSLMTELRNAAKTTTRGGVLSLDVVYKDGMLRLARPSGELVPMNTRGASFSPFDAKAYTLLNDANRLLDIQKTLGVNVDERAQLFINDFKGVARPAPASQKGTTNEAAPNSTAAAATSATEGNPTPKATIAPIEPPSLGVIAPEKQAELDKARAPTLAHEAPKEVLEKDLVAYKKELDRKDLSGEQRGIVTKNIALIEKAIKVRTLEYGPDGKRKVSQ